MNISIKRILLEGTSIINYTDDLLDKLTNYFKKYNIPKSNNLSIFKLKLDTYKSYNIISFPNGKNERKRSF